MKKLLIVPLLLLSISFSSCEKVTVQEQNTIVQGDKTIIDPGAVFFGTCDGWYISSFQKDKLDLTQNYSSLKMVFCPNNTVVVSNDLFAVTGQWNLVVKDEIPLQLVINFNTAASLPGQLTFQEAIAGNWDIVRYERNMLWLNDTRNLKVMVIGRGALN